MNTTLISTADTTVTETSTTRARFVRAGLVAGVGAAAVNTVVVAAADAADVSLKFHNDPRAIPVIGFAQITLVATLIAIGLAAVLRRRSARPAALFTRITVALTALSLVPPMIVDADGST